MDTALGILARSLQGSTASGTGSTAGSSKSNDVFAALFSQFAGNQALQAGQLARSAPLPPPTTQTLASDPRPATDYSAQADGNSATATDSKASDQPAASAADDGDGSRPQENRGFKSANADRPAGNAHKTDKAAKPQKGDGNAAAQNTADAKDAADAKSAADTQDRADAKDKADAADAADAKAQAGKNEDQKVADEQAAGDPILAVMPMATQQLITPKPVAAGDAPAVGKGAVVAGKGAQGPAGKAGPLLKGMDPRQIAAGPDPAAGDAPAGAGDAAADAAPDALQGASSPLNGFAAALAGNGPGPNAQAALAQARDPGQLAPQAAAAQLVQAVDTGAGGNGGDSNGALAGDGGSGNARGGAEARMPDGSQMVGSADGPRETSGASFADTLASVRSARPGMAAGATDQVAVQLQHSAKDGNGSISMQLRPEELGRIDIKLNIDQQGLVNATITADRPQTLELLQKDSRSLEKALQDAGLQTDSSSLSFNLRGEGGQGNNQQGFQGDGSRPGRNTPQPVAALDSAPSADIALVTRRYQVANGRIDVRI